MTPVYEEKKTSLEETEIKTHSSEIPRELLLVVEGDMQSVLVEKYVVREVTGTDELRPSSSSHDDSIIV